MPGCWQLPPSTAAAISRAPFLTRPASIALNHHPNHRFGARSAQHDSAAAFEPPFHLLDHPRTLRLGHVDRSASATRTLSSTCGYFRIAAASSASPGPVCFIMASTCRALIKPSPVVVLSRHRMCPEVSPPKVPRSLIQHGEDIAIADLRAQELDAARLEGVLQS